MIHRDAPCRGDATAGRVLLALFLLGAFAPAASHATPSTNFWAPSTPGVQGFGILHLTYDTYFNEKAVYPIDVGLEIGVLPWKPIQAELGFDLFYPTSTVDGPLETPLLLNAKIGSPEDAYFKGSPAWSVGIFGVGFEEDVTDYDVLHAVVGKTLSVGSVAFGGYYGLNRNLFRSSAGEEERAGFIGGWFSPALDVPMIDRIHFTWDVQTGMNVFGATGIGACIYVTPTVDVITGPVFFYDEALQPGGSSWMWTMQVDVDVSLIGGR
jgi:hypothetical protein